MTGPPQFRTYAPDELPKQYDAAVVEARWRQRWADDRRYRWDRTRPRSETFAVDTPPPTASGSLHMGHVFSYSHADMLVRYHRMRGENIFYPMGWDDNGLPTERRVQDYFHITCDPAVPYDPGLVLEADNGKKAGPPRPVSRRNFVEACHRVTQDDERVFKDLFQRTALSVDWELEYTTIGDLARGVAQRSFLDLFARGHIYQTDAPTMWDPEFQTAVAQAEVEDREQDGAFHDITFAVEGSDETFTIATTRPELLSACVGVTAHPDDARYRHLFGRHAVTPIYGALVPIFASDKADPEVGSGILMVCTFGDQTDVLWWRTEGLQLRQVLGRNGRVVARQFGTPGWESLRPEAANRAFDAIVGKSVSQARAVVVEQLRDPAHAWGGGTAPLKGEPRPIRRSVRFYERSKMPLEYVTSRQWYVRLTDKKDELLDRGRDITWRPDFMRKRYENWTEGLGWDWLISRQRYFGVPIPVWYPVDQHGVTNWLEPILTSVDRLPIDPMSDAPPGYEPSQRNQPGGFTGEPDVFDTWFTSSMTPQIGAHWDEPDDAMDRLFPMDMRPQSHEIIRTWAFYTIAKALLHHGTVPWRQVVISGWILDPDRKKMSKSKGNVVTPVGLLDQYGADAVRYWAAGARLGVDTAFDEQQFRVGGRLVTKLFNAARFVLTQPGEDGPISRELDRAFVAELRTLLERCSAAFAADEFSQSLALTESAFFGAFTDNYLELTKARARDTTDAAGQASALATLRLTLGVMLRLFAPFLPHVTDELWSWSHAAVTGHDSVHFAPWPDSAELAAIASPAHAASFDMACQAIAAIRKARSQASIGLGLPLTSARLAVREDAVAALSVVVGDVAAAARAGSLELATEAELRDPVGLATITWEPAPA